MTTPTTTKHFSIQEALSFGWTTFKKNIWLLIGLAITYLLAVVIISALDTITFGLASIAGSMILGMGGITIVLKFVDGQKPEILDLFRTYRPFLNYLAVSVLYTLLVMVGLVLFIVPGIYWALRYAYGPFLVVDRNLGPLQALKASSEITQGVKWNLLGFVIVLALLNFVGVILLLVGYLITAPITWIASAWVYRKLLNQTSLSQSLPDQTATATKSPKPPADQSSHSTPPPPQ